VSQPEKVYVVMEVGWGYNDEDYFPLIGEEDGEPEGAPVRAFRSREAAEHYRLQREREVRSPLNPFTYCSDEDALYEVSDDDLHQLIEELGIEDPVLYELHTWHRLGEWWGLYGEWLPEEVKDLVWETLYQVPFFEVVELEVGE
jgi:hypothetical protein